ncbi:MAG: pyridoxine 5'-phosphate synthase [Candidatus Margulisbacteria bacterium GWF2_35_9]|nr:MAG: pyridoxine 5'-phosphate synthase [Candidatus Margulisbacteria bacterium GWF2_35_9]
MPKLLLGVNIDHIATIREARKGIEPDPLAAALIAERFGADLITIHLREDRRHINDDDVYKIKKAISIPLNLEMAPVDEIVKIALDVKPYKVTLVPERREEVTTEGGLDVRTHLKAISTVNRQFKKAGIIVSLFIEADMDQILASKESGAECIEIHTGSYSNASSASQKKELERIKKAVKYANEIGLIVHAGHGLNNDNVKAIAEIEGVEELNIGHSIISDAVLRGLGDAIRSMKENMV